MTGRVRTRVRMRIHNSPEIHFRKKSPHTRAYEEHVLLGLINSAVSDVHTKDDSGYEAVMGITERRISNLKHKC
jgi:hypothetical protein